MDSLTEKGHWLEGATKWGVVLGSSFWLVSAGAVAGFWAKLPPQLPWFYSLPWGAQRLIEKPYLIGFILGFGLLWLLDLNLARWWGGEDPLLKQILIWGGVATELLLMLTLVRIIGIVL